MGKKNKIKFEYEVEVEIIDGFYKGIKGKVIEFRTVGVWLNKKEYLISSNSFDFNLWIGEEKLKKGGK